MGFLDIFSKKKKKPVLQQQQQMPQQQQQMPQQQQQMPQQQMQYGQRQYGISSFSTSNEPVEKTEEELKEEQERQERLKQQTKERTEKLNGKLMDVYVNLETSHILLKDDKETDADEKNKDGDIIINGTIDVTTGLKPKIETEDEPQRPPLNLALVLDKSGSMGGDRIRFALQAICRVIDQLNDDDVVHFVSYNNSSKIEFHSETVGGKQDSLKKIVNKLSAGGGTKIMSGIESAEKVLKEYTKKNDKTEFDSRIFLFSDGQDGSAKVAVPNKCEKLLNEDIRTSSFGIGMGFDSDLMSAISKKGAGSFFFIKQASDISKFVDAALFGLFSIIGSSSVLKIEGVNDVECVKVFNYDSPLVVELGDLKEENNRAVVFQFKCTAKDVKKHAKAKEGDEEKKDDALSMQIGKWTLTYKSSDEEKGDQKLEGVINASFTKDQAVVEENTNYSVKIQVMLQQSGEMDNELAEALKGAFNKEKFLGIADKQIALLKEAAELDEENLYEAGRELDKAKKTRKDLESGNQQKASKSYQHQWYKKKRNSIAYAGLY